MIDVQMRQIMIYSYVINLKEMTIGADERVVWNILSSELQLKLKSRGVLTVAPRLQSSVEHEVRYR
jgi:hypothetical protein